ncbi:hypothetical protein JCM21714_1500 [Gracilibacillus boraciitolerans JCM 21714]|uniref:TATA-box binding n=1 Tax=Gracilibacillus boraciitolerans JCM 21714 TaxID=1298598 RepID=W4VH74_9BACI|nr:YwmB family TATA-box binding protein [Gracilibacillus boraciitolerans]GAE92496.1 hypothetical protein JCM21714_1500 [Gracilibacillus boraciitolerans JCM 21714]
MKYLFLFLFLFTWSSIFALHVESHKDTNNVKQIEDMLELVDQQNLNLLKWQTIIKETREINNINQFKDHLKGYQMSVTKNKSHITFTKDTQETGGFNEQILLVKANMQNTYQVIYIIESSKTTTEVLEAYKKRMNTITSDLFTKNAQTFSCIEAWKNDIIDIVRFINIVNSTLKMSIIDETKENNFYTWTGYTKKWTDTIQQDEKEFNIQIAVRAGLGDRTNVTIGTPILINEY